MTLTITSILTCLGAILLGWLSYRVRINIAGTRGSLLRLQGRSTERVFITLIVRSMLATLAIVCALLTLREWGVLR